MTPSITAPHEICPWGRWRLWRARSSMISRTVCPRTLPIAALHSSMKLIPAGSPPGSSPPPLTPRLFCVCLYLGSSACTCPSLGPPERLSPRLFHEARPWLPLGSSACTCPSLGSPYRLSPRLFCEARPWLSLGSCTCPSLGSPPPPPRFFHEACPCSPPGSSTRLTPSRMVARCRREGLFPGVFEALVENHHSPCILNLTIINDITITSPCCVAY